MKRKILSVLLVSCIMGSALMFSGCSDEEEVTDETEKTATAPSTVEEEEETTASEETEMVIEPVVITSLTWWGADNGDWEVDALTDTAIYTNTYEMDLVSTFDSTPIFYLLNCTVTRDGETVYDGTFPESGITENGQSAFPTNDQGYVIPGDYVVSIFYNDELIGEATATVNFDEATAPELGIITHRFGLADITHYDNPDQAGWMEPTDFYQAGCTGIYTRFHGGVVLAQGTYEVEWSYNGTPMETLTYDYDTDRDSFDTYHLFSFENPDGSPLQAGTYEFSYYYDSELMLTDTITIK